MRGSAARSYGIHGGGTYHGCSSAKRLVLLAVIELTIMMPLVVISKVGLCLQGACCVSVGDLPVICWDVD